MSTNKYRSKSTLVYSAFASISCYLFLIFSFYSIIGIVIFFSTYLVCNINYFMII